MSECYLAVDVGGNKLAAAIVAANGDVLMRDRVPTPQRDVWPALSRLVLRLQAAAPVAPSAVGVGCGGPMDPEAGTVAPLHIPSLAGFHLQREMQEATQLPTAVDNTAKAVALAEGWLGAARGVSDFIAVVIGSGVGGGIVSNGRLLEGRLGNAGHIGHMVVELDGRSCQCGGKGCLEAYCGGRAIEEETGRPPQRAPQSIIERTGVLTGRALASVAAVCDLRLAVVGGAVALGFGEPFFQAANTEIEQRARMANTAGLTAVPAELGNMAPLVGAAALARRMMLQRAR